MCGGRTSEEREREKETEREREIESAQHLIITWIAACFAGKALVSFLYIPYPHLTHTHTYRTHSLRQFPPFWANFGFMALSAFEVPSTKIYAFI